MEDLISIPEFEPTPEVVPELPELVEEERPSPKRGFLQFVAALLENNGFVKPKIPLVWISLASVLVLAVNGTIAFFYLRVCLPTLDMGRGPMDN